MNARIAVCVLLAGVAMVAEAKNGAFKHTKHGDAMAGPQRRADQPRGACLQCHDGLHAMHSGAASPSSDSALFAPNDNDLCLSCHAGPSAGAIFPGGAPWAQGAHARSQDATRCVTCHDPHGNRDKAGLIPSLLSERDSALCIACHDGSRGKDIRRELEKPYRHASGRNRHQAGEITPSSFSTTAGNRHAECVDCHNPHRLDSDPAPPSPPQASNRLANVSRLQVANGGAGAAPTYVWRTPDDGAFANEYEICFKCHSSWTTQPPGQSNLAALTNPANASFHPIQAPGKNPAIDPAAFVNGYTAQSMVLCTDCHSSDDRSIRGPHGSSYPYLLKKPSATTLTAQPATPEDLCFECHSFATYAATNASDAEQRASRFNAPQARGHNFHSGQARIPCYACHETHGSNRPALIATRPFAIIGFTQTASGGTCTSSCHVSRTYMVNYSR
jgi:predicted CXXCH cytochrome family protein